MTYRIVSFIIYGGARTTTDRTRRDLPSGE
jgi:hypothetical protein